MLSGRADLSGTINNKSGSGGVSSKRQGRGSPQKNLGTILAKPFPIPKCFGSQKISAKISGKTKRGLYLLVEFSGIVAKICRGLYFLIVTIGRIY